MSGIHKRTMLKQALRLGLEPVPEGSLASLKSTEAELRQYGTASGRLMDMEMEAKYEAAKSTIFPIQEVYKNPENGLLFNTYYSPPKSQDVPIFVCHHGAGSSAMTFGCLARCLQKSDTEEDRPGVFVFDARGHGEFRNDVKSFLLLDFSADFNFVLNEFIVRNKPKNSLCLVGHSLGGAVMTDFVCQHSDTDLDIRGLVVIDIVEETAVRALSSISVFIQKRPKSFDSYSQCILWHIQSRLLRNEESAKISVPGLLVRGPGNTLTWKAKLGDMAQSWHTWFEELSSKFLDCNLKKRKLSKLLILSSNETLDKKLTIGQMQGKFQLIVFNNSTNAGHFLHEDIPQQINSSLVDFVRRYSSASLRNQQKSIESLWGGKIHN